MDVNQPRIIDTPEPITVLESAWRALDDITSKSVHLEPRQAEAIRIEHMQLKHDSNAYAALQVAYVLLQRQTEHLAEMIADDSPAHPFEGCDSG